MKKIISMTRLVEAREVTKGTREVIATAEAAFDERKSVLTVELDSHVLVTNARGQETRVPEDWLPARQTVRESMPVEEAVDAAKEIFERWAGKVHESVPGALTK